MEEEVPKKMKARAYQTELETKSLEHNTIIYLPTGSGKTFIAIQIIKRLQKDVQAPFSLGGKRSFFLVNSVALVEQQVECVRNLTPLKVCGYSSEDKVDVWLQTDWLKQLEETQVLVMTAQILVDLLLHHYILLSQINLLIFDECHHAVDKHPMRRVMMQFEHIPVQQQPRVIGLTATLLNKNVNPNQVEQEIKELEKTFHAKISTTESLTEVMKYSTNPTEKMLEFPEYTLISCDQFAHITLEKVKEMVATVMLEEDAVTSMPIPDHTHRMIKEKKTVTKLANSVDSCLRSLKILGSFGGSVSMLALIMMLERHKLKVKTAPHFDLLQIIITQLALVRGRMEKEMAKCRELDRLTKFSSPKLKMLLQVLAEYSPIANKASMEVNIHREKLCGIIFVQERFTAKVISLVLKHAKLHHPSLGFLEVDFAVGYNLNPYSDTREGLYEKKQNKIVLNKFSTGLLNCIVSTEVLEEGIDIPRCTLVIRFDKVLNFRSYLQAKGRGRSKTASYAMLVAQPDYNAFLDTHRCYRQIEDTLNDVLVGKTIDRNQCTAEEMAEVYSHLCPPYIYKNASVTMDSSISLLHRYCSMLPQDKFTVLQPEYFIKSHSQGNLKQVSCCLYLPVSSSIKDLIQGPMMDNKKDAKRAACLQACIRLHQAGELNDNLLPRDKTREPLDNSIEKQLFSHWPEDANADKKKAGVKGKWRIYEKKIPKCLCGTSKPSPSYRFYMHSIRIVPKRESEDKQCGVIYDSLEDPLDFAILTYRPMPELCKFSLFLSTGEVLVEITPNEKEVQMSEAEFQEMKRFHFMVFFDVLRIQVLFLSYNTTNTGNNYFTAPIIRKNGKIFINWPVILENKAVEEIEEPSVQARKETPITRDAYQLKILVPWYRGGSYHTRYIVTEVCESMTPNSPFPDSNFSSFSHYFQAKYELRLLGSSAQPMLKVKYLSGKMNALLPRALSIAHSGMTRAQFRKNYGSFADDVPFHDELLVPELCMKFSFPGILWLKATLLPSILHRMTCLLQAEELRSTIAAETGLGCYKLPQGTHWDTLTCDSFTTSRSQRAEASGKPSEPPTVMDCTDLGQEVFSTTGPEALPRGDNFQLSVKKIDSQFPWMVESEPLDIDRNLMSITVADIACYESFVSTKVEGATEKKQAPPPATHQPGYKPEIINTRAICAAPYKYVEHIDILSRRPTPLEPQLGSVLEALTISKCNDVFSLERLETLGDSFLKMAASLYVWQHLPDISDEGRMTALKGRIVSNRNLYYSSLDKDIARIMKVSCFRPKTDLIIPGFSVTKVLENLIIDAEIAPSILYSITISRDEMLSGNMTAATMGSIGETLMEWANDETSSKSADGMENFLGRQNVQDKAVSDSVEALIGVYLLNGGIEAAFKVLQWFRVLPKTDDALSLMKSRVSTPLSEGHTTRDKVSFFLDHCQSQIEDILQYKFRDPCFLLQAMTHSSNIRNRLTGSYERLEFLGDAILDFLITCHIYENCGLLDPGDLTDLRSALVNNNTFACLVVRLELHKYLLSSSPLLDKAILKFVSFQCERDHLVDEAVLYLLEEEGCQLAEYVEIPKALGDIFESLAGAIYLDSGNSLETVWRVMYRLMHREIAAFSANVPKQPVRILLEDKHASATLMKGISLDNGIIMVPVRFRLKGEWTVVHGFGKNKAWARRAAAKIALRMMGKTTI